MILENYLDLLDLEKGFVLVFGCFDILHIGHINFLRCVSEQAKLPVAVGLLDDALIKAMKGDKRPIISQNDRLQVIDSIKYINYAFVVSKGCDFDYYRHKYDLSEKELGFWCKNMYCIECLKPKAIYCSTDFHITSEIGQFLEDHSLSVIPVPYSSGVCTTDIINNIKKAYSE